MSGEQVLVRLYRLGSTYPWAVAARSTDDRIVIHRWIKGASLTKQEVHVVLDSYGRISGFSIWESKRQGIDFENGKRLRLEDLLTSRITA